MTRRGHGGRLREAGTSDHGDTAQRGGVAAVFGVSIVVVAAVPVLVGLVPAVGPLDAGAPGGSMGPPAPALSGELATDATAADPAARCSVSETTIAPGESVTLDASASEDATAYRYDKFGDGGFGDWLDRASLDVTYDQEGTYEPQVQVRSADDRTDIASCGTLTVESPNDGPTAEFTYSPTEPTTGETVSFDSTTSDPDGEIVGHEWRVDGEVVGDQPSLEYAFPGPGEYTVSLTITDDDGATTTAERTVTVQEDNESPVVRYTYTPTELSPDETATFESDASDPDGEIVGHEWKVDGEVVGESATLQYAFPGPGEYTVSLTVTDDDGTSATTSKRLTVSDNEPPAVDIAYSPQEPASGETIAFEAEAEDPDGEIVEYLWQVDGEVVGDQPSLEYAFPGPGEYTVSLTGTHDNGATDSAEVTVTVEERESTTTETPQGEVELTAQWGYSPLAPQSGQRVTLFASGPSDPRITYRWDVGDDGTVEDRGRLVTHVFSATGNHTVTLEAVGPDGERRTTTRTIGVREGGSGGGDGGLSLSMTPLDPQPGQRVTLIADPAVPPGEVAGYRWDFNGDGESDAEGRTVTTAFPNDGEFSMGLTVERTNGSTTEVEGSVPVRGPGLATDPTTDDSTTDGATDGDEDTTDNGSGDEDTTDNGSPGLGVAVALVALLAVAALAVWGAQR